MNRLIKKLIPNVIRNEAHNNLIKEVIDIISSRVSKSGLFKKANKSLKSIISSRVNQSYNLKYLWGC
jgi:hypothetical protein